MHFIFCKPVGLQQIQDPMFWVWQNVVGSEDLKGCLWQEAEEILAMEDTLSLLLGRLFPSQLWSRLRTRGWGEGCCPRLLLGLSHHILWEELGPHIISSLLAVLLRQMSERVYASFWEVGLELLRVDNFCQLHARDEVQTGGWSHLFKDKTYYLSYQEFDRYLLSQVNTLAQKTPC